MCYLVTQVTQDRAGCRKKVYRLFSSTVEPSIEKEGGKRGC
jgi:hypothetical protein